MSNGALNVYQSGAKTYRTEAWKKDYNEVKKCFELEDFLATGVRIVDGLFMLDEKHRARVFAGEVEFDPEMHRHIRLVYAEMAEAFKQLLEPIQEHEKIYGEVKNAAEVRSHLSELNGILTPDDEFFGTGLVPLRDAALDANLGGGAIECGSWK